LGYGKTYQSTIYGHFKMNPQDKISKYLTVGDAIKSETAIRRVIDNSMTEYQLAFAKYVAIKVFDPIKDKFPRAGCYSFFRSEALNKAVGGSKNSFHSFAAAIDIDTLGNVDNRAIFKFVIDGGVPFSQVIWEFGDLRTPEWVHVGLIQGDQRHDIKRIYTDADGTHNQLLTKEQAYEIFKL
jgi:zinc D-Ala-D-Ala carboxypeptidase